MAHGPLFIKTSPVKQYSYENDFSGVFDAFYQSFLVIIVVVVDDDNDDYDDDAFDVVVHALHKLCIFMN